MSDAAKKPRTARYETPTVGVRARLLTLREVAEILGVSPKTLRRRIDDGQLSVIRDGRILRVHPRDLERYIASRRTL